MLTSCEHLGRDKHIIASLGSFVSVLTIPLRHRLSTNLLLLESVGIVQEGIIASAQSSDSNQIHIQQRRCRLGETNRAASDWVVDADRFLAGLEGLAIDSPPGFNVRSLTI